MTDKAKSKKPKDDHIKFHMSAQMQRPTFWGSDGRFIGFMVDTYYFNTGRFTITLN